jgi:hypothetical protein
MYGNNKAMTIIYQDAKQTIAFVNGVLYNYIRECGIMILYSIMAFLNGTFVKVVTLELIIVSLEMGN